MKLASLPALALAVGGLFVGSAPAQVAPAQIAPGPCGWERLAGGPEGYARTLIVHDDGAGDALFVGGTFFGFGDAAMTHVARYDGTGWSPLGSGVDGPVHAFASFDLGMGPALAVVGDFTSAGGLPAPGIAFWNGWSWSAPPPTGLTAVRAAAQVPATLGPRLAVGGTWPHVPGATPAFALAFWDGAGWSAEQTTNTTITGLTAHEGALFAAGVFGIEVRTAASTTLFQTANFFPKDFAVLPTENGDRLHSFGTGFELATVGLPPVPKGRALQMWEEGDWQVRELNVAASHFATWHSVNAAAAWNAPHGPSFVLAGDFARQSGTWIENHGLAYRTWVHHGNAVLEVLLPLPTQLTHSPAAFVSFDDGRGERLFAGGAGLHTGDVSLGAVAVLEPCLTSPPAWTEANGCTTAPTRLSSPFDQPVVGTPFRLEARSKGGMLGEAYLIPALGLYSSPFGCGTVIPGVGELLIAGFLGTGAGPLVLPGFFQPVGPLVTIAQWEIGVPAAPALVGLELAFQVLTQDLFSGSFDLTNALLVEFGN